MEIKEAYCSFEIAKLLKEKGFDVRPYDQYYVSSCGKVFGCKGDEMRTEVSNRGYKRVWLTINGKRERYSVHRLVALCFIPNPDKKLEVNHIDGNKLNNDVSNLEWCTRSENEQHAWKNGLKPNLVKGKFGKDHISSKPIVCVETGKVYGCHREVAEERGTNINSTSHLTRACKYGYLDKGYHWRYYEPNELVKLLFEKGYTKYPMSYDGEIWYCYVQLAMAWVRSKGYSVEVHATAGGWNWEVCKVNGTSIAFGGTIPSDNTNEGGAFDDYDECMENALKYCLENLI